MPAIAANTVDVYVIATEPAGWKVLVLQRATSTRCPLSWETVHGHVEPGETAEEAALREVREETGLEVVRLYNVTVQPFFLHRAQVVELAVVFAAFVAGASHVTTGDEHCAHEWLAADAAMQRFFWPRERAALAEAMALLSGGDGGPAEDVLRVR